MIEKGREGRGSGARGRATVLLVGLLGVLALAGRSAAAGDPVSASGDRGMVVTSVAPAAPVGAEVLAHGGNAADAAIAMGFAVGCAHQFSSGIGGGGFFLIWDANEKRAYALDAREIAPRAVTPGLFNRADGTADPNAIREGGKSVAVPSLVLGFEEVHRRFGKLPWKDLVEAAAVPCKLGIDVTPYHHGVLEAARKKLERHPETLAVQMGEDKEPLPVGAKLVQNDLAQTYMRIASEGPQAMRRGPLVEAMVNAARADGGVLSEEDVAGYQPVWREPIRGDYRGYQVIAMPPPSSGGVHVVQMLNTLERFDLKRWGPQSPQTLHVLAETMKLAFADRAVLMGDPDYAPVPVEYLTSKTYGAELAAKLEPGFWHFLPWKWGEVEILQVRRPVQPPRDAGTTHISVMDADGNAVSMTQTVNTLFGSGITAGDTGIVLNNEMDDFALAPGVPNSFGLLGARANAVESEKRPLSSMTPAFVLRDGKPILVAGSPQGPYIITTVLQTILNVVDFGMSAQDAVRAPRIHHQWMPDELQVEPTVPADLVAKLRAMGHPVKQLEDGFGASVTIVRDAKTGRFFGGADPRRDTRAAAP